MWSSRLKEESLQSSGSKRPLCSHLIGLRTTVKVPLSQPCFDHFFGPCFRGHDDEAGLLAFSMSLFSDVGPLEAIAENKTEQKSAAKRRQRLLKAPLKPPSCAFSHSWRTWPTIPWKPWKFAEKHGQHIAYSWFNSMKKPYLKKNLRMWADRPKWISRHSAERLVGY